MLAGHTRVEVRVENAAQALGWAQRVDGRPHDGLTPLWVYRATPAVD